MVSTRTTVGSIGILANHAPLLAMLDPTELRLYKSESEIVRFAQAEGYLQVADNHALMLVEEAHDAERARRRRAARAPAAGRAASSSEAERGLRAPARRRARQAPLGGVLESPRAPDAGRRALSERQVGSYRFRRMVDERILAERLIAYDTSQPEDLVAAAGFVKGWLESRDIEVRDHEHNGLPVLVAEVGPAPTDVPCVVFHGHLDVVPGRPEQFEPRVEGDRLIGRGAYDMKGGLAAMMCALKDVERPGPGARAASSASPTRSPRRSTSAPPTRVVSARPRRRLRDHRRADRPAHRRRGQGRAGDADRGPRAAPRTARPRGWATTPCSRRSTCSARSSRCRSARESSEMFDRPSINLGRIEGGDALNKVPDACTMAVDVRYLPGQDPGEILAQVRAIAGHRRRPGRSSGRRCTVSRTEPVRARAARGGRALDPTARR